MDTGSHWTLEDVVGDRCRDALRSLLRDEYQGLCVELLDEAFALCRRKAEEHKRQRRGLAEPGVAAGSGGIK